MDFKGLLSWLITSDHNLELFSTSVWLIRTQKNQVRLSKPNISVHQIASSAKEQVTEFALTQYVPSIPRPDLTSTWARWRPPTQGVVKINCDEATFKE